MPNTREAGAVTLGRPVQTRSTSASGARFPRVRESGTMAAHGPTPHGDDR